MTISCVDVSVFLCIIKIMFFEDQLHMVEYKKQKKRQAYEGFKLVQKHKLKLIEMKEEDHSLIGQIYYLNKERAFMHKYSGQNLQQYFKRQSSVYERARLFKEILKSLQLLWKGKIVHGDIHTGNVVFQQQHIRLVDFDMTARDKIIKPQQSFVQPKVFYDIKNLIYNIIKEKWDQNELLFEHLQFFVKKMMSKRQQKEVHSKIMALPFFEFIINPDKKKPDQGTKKQEQWNCWKKVLKLQVEGNIPNYKTDQNILFKFNLLGINMHNVKLNLLKPQQKPQ